jgi:exonuclease III
MPAQGIIIDGRFQDWASVAPIYRDARDDQLESDIDFGVLKVASDSMRIYLGFEIGVERNLQNDNEIVLYLDTDNSSQTGRSVGGIGADLQWAFGRRVGTAHISGDTVGLNQSHIGLRQGPTVTSTKFEISLRRSSMVKWVPLFPQDTIAILFRNEEEGVQDVLPDAPRKLEIILSGQRPVQYTPTPLSRQDPGHLRVVSYNVLFDGLFERPGPFMSVLQALDPDIICFQEIWKHSAKETADLVSLMLPDAPWYAEKGHEGVIVSRYPIIDSYPTNEETGNLWALIDLPDERFAADLSLINAHPPCCENNAGRELELDAMAAWIRELQSPGGRELIPGTPIVIAGDMNLVGPARQLEILLAGRIVNQELFGPSQPPDWDGTALADVMPYHTNGREAYTWRSIDNYDSSFAPGRLDYILYSDSVLELGNHFVLCTSGMSPEELTAAGLVVYDTAVASDHLPVVADFIFPVSATGDRTVKMEYKEQKKPEDFNK